MKNRKLILLVGSIWEVIRFALLYFLLLLLVNSSFNPIGSILLIWLGSIQLILAAGLFFAWWDMSRYAVLLPLLALGKGLNLIPPILLLIFGSGLFNISGSLFQAVADVSAETAVRNILSQESLGFLFLFAGGILFFDLIFFFIILSYRVRRKEQELGSDRNLPDWKDIRVEEE